MLSSVRIMRAVLALAIAAAALVRLASGAELTDLQTGESPWKASLPGAEPRTVALDADLSGVESISLKVRLRENPGALVKVLFFCQNAEGLYYQTATAGPLRASKWEKLSWSLAGDSADLEPVGFLRPWDARVAKGVRAAGLKIFANRPCSVELDVAEVVVTPAAADSAAPPARCVVDCRLPARSAPVDSRVELGFRLRPEPADPFASKPPAEAVFITPSGSRVRAGAFLYQDYRPVGASGCERLVPCDAPRWLVRFRPSEEGRYRYRLTLGAEEVASGWFDATAAERAPAKPPTLHPSLFDGTAVEESDLTVDLTKVFGEAGRSLIPTDRVAVADGREWRLGAHEAPSRGWWVPLEWTSAWGMWTRGEYQMRLAWLFDRVLERAEAAGVSMPLVLARDGVFFDEGKFRWAMNPLNAAQGGPLASPWDYYASAEALAGVERLASYACARWGYSRAVSEWCFGMRTPAAGVEDWHAKVREIVASADGLGKPLISLSPLATGFSRRGRLGTFEDGNVWAAGGPSAAGVKLARTDEAASEGTHSLRVTGSFPGDGVWLWREVDKNLFDYPTLSVDVLVPQAGPRDMRVQVYVRDGSLLWYELTTPTMLRPGGWTRVLVPLDGSAPFAPKGHDCPWGDWSRTRIRELGLRFWCPEEYSGPFYIDNVSVLGGQAGAAEGAPCSIAMESEPRREVGVLDLCELSFRLSRHYSNPFDPEVVDVYAEIRRPDGRTDTVNAFWHQLYGRALEKMNTSDGLCDCEVLRPAGAPLWKLRYSPQLAGEHSVELFVKEKGRIAARRGPFSVRALASDRPGFARVAPDKRHFELSTGEFLYPLGMNLRSPTDSRDIDRDRETRRDVLLAGHRGTYQYDDYFDAMQRARMNWARIWMCSWWCGLEWYHKWPGYGGLGVYNMENAWRLDYLLEEARRRGIYVQLYTMNHGQVSPAIDHEWEFNPYNYYDADAYEQTAKDQQIRVVRPDRVRPGGLVKSATEFFTDEQARKWHRNKLRYIVARWGHCPAVMAWVLCSEMEFSEEYWLNHYNGDNASPMLANWCVEMAEYLKKTDPYQHIVTTHFSHPIRGNITQRRPEMEFLQSNAYSSFWWFGASGMSWERSEKLRAELTRQGRSDQLDQAKPPVGAPAAMSAYFYQFMRAFMRPRGVNAGALTAERPVLIGEWGGHWMENSGGVLDAELHTGLWATAATPMAGATGYWWWPHVHFRNRYPHYAALANFMAGEDRRGLDLAEARLALAGEGAGRLAAMGVQTRELADVYVYAKEAIRTLEGIEPVTGAKLRITGLAPGPVRVELWDTFRGEIRERRTARAGPDGLEMDLGAVRIDTAIKIRPDRSGVAREAPAETSGPQPGR